MGKGKRFFARDAGGLWDGILKSMEPHHFVSDNREAFERDQWKLLNGERDLLSAFSHLGLAGVLRQSLGCGLLLLCLLRSAVSLSVCSQ